MTVAQRHSGVDRVRLARSAHRAVALALGLSSPAALAHGNMNAGAFYQGMATAFVHADLLLFFLAAALYTAQQPSRDRPWLGLLTVSGVGAGFVAALWGWVVVRPALVAAAAFVLVGLLVAARLTRPAWLGAILAGGAALGAGLALGTAELPGIRRPLLFIAGLMLAAGMCVFYIVAGISRLPGGWPWIGVRVLGSWIAAAGIMVGAYAWRAT